LAGIVKADDVILTMGAGNVGHIAAQLPELLAETLNCDRDANSCISEK
jgi:UDP-N-acetylmuramate--alanine ligase